MEKRVRQGPGARKWGTLRRTGNAKSTWDPTRMAHHRTAPGTCVDSLTDAAPGDLTQLDTRGTGLQRCRLPNRREREPRMGKDRDGFQQTRFQNLSPTGVPRSRRRGGGTAPPPSTCRLPRVKGRQTQPGPVRHDGGLARPSWAAGPRGEGAAVPGPSQDSAARARSRLAPAPSAPTQQSLLKKYNEQKHSGKGEAPGAAAEAGPWAPSPAGVGTPGRARGCLWDPREGAVTPRSPARCRHKRARGPTTQDSCARVPRCSPEGAHPARGLHLGRSATPRGARSTQRALVRGVWPSRAIC